MGRVYAAAWAATSVTAALDLFEIVAPADAIVELLEIRIGQETEFGDAEEELLELNGLYGYTTSGSGGAALTPRPLEEGDAAFGGTFERLNTTVASGGTPLGKLLDTWNVRVGFLWVPTPECRITISPSGRFVLRQAAPADSIDIGGTVVFEERGG